MLSQLIGRPSIWVPLAGTSANTAARPMSSAAVRQVADHHLITVVSLQHYVRASQQLALIGPVPAECSPQGVVDGAIGRAGSGVCGPAHILVMHPVLVHPNVAKRLDCTDAWVEGQSRACRAQRPIRLRAPCPAWP
ncbi:MAG: hypothetical protein ACI91O_001446 [Candidatus Poriferisodalaceae bacterium]|jgi:hypothetical protein